MHSLFPIRTKHFINAFGEELIVENADSALAEACRILNVEVSDYTAAPVYLNDQGKGSHEWLIEFDKAPDNMQQFREELDKALKATNSDYEAKRQKDIALQMPVVRILPKGTFHQWLKSKGKLGGQHKVPRLSNNREYVDGILELFYVEYYYQNRPYYNLFLPSQAGFCRIHGCSFYGQKTTAPVFVFGESKFTT